MSKKERDNLAQVFKKFDKNGDGMLSFEEVKTGYREFYNQDLQNSEVKKIFDAVDTDNSGFIDYSEFLTATLRER